MAAPRSVIVRRPKVQPAAKALDTVVGYAAIRQFHEIEQDHLTTCTDVVRCDKPSSWPLGQFFGTY